MPVFGAEDIATLARVDDCADSLVAVPAFALVILNPVYSSVGLTYCGSKFGLLSSFVSSLFGGTILTGGGKTMCLGGCS